MTQSSFRDWKANHSGIVDTTFSLQRERLYDFQVSFFVFSFSFSWLALFFKQCNSLCLYRFVWRSPPLEIACFSEVAVKPLNEREILANHSANLRVKKLITLICFLPLKQKWVFLHSLVTCKINTWAIISTMAYFKMKEEINKTDTKSLQRYKGLEKKQDKAPLL